MERENGVRECWAWRREAAWNITVVVIRAHQAGAHLTIDLQAGLSSSSPNLRGS